MSVVFDLEEHYRELRQFTMLLLTVRVVQIVLIFNKVSDLMRINEEFGFLR